MERLPDSAAKGPKPDPLAFNELKKAADDDDVQEQDNEAPEEPAAVEPFKDDQKEELKVKDMEQEDNLQPEVKQEDDEIVNEIEE